MDYRIKDKKGCREVLVVFQIFTRDGWGTPSKSKAAGTITKKLSNILHKCNQEPSLFETDEKN